MDFQNQKRKACYIHLQLRVLRVLDSHDRLESRSRRWIPHALEADDLVVVSVSLSPGLTWNLVGVASILMLDASVEIEVEVVEMDSYGFSTVSGQASLPE